MAKYKLHNTVCWVCIDALGRIDEGSTGSTRSASIDTYLYRFGTHHNYTWKKLYRWGHRCVRVRMVIVDAKAAMYITKKRIGDEEKPKKGKHKQLEMF